MVSVTLIKNLFVTSIHCYPSCKHCNKYRITLSFFWTIFLLNIFFFLNESGQLTPKQGRMKLS